MDAELDCIACNIKRIVIGVTPVARGYEMRSLECPRCSNLYRLVLRHRRPRPKTLGYRSAEPLTNDNWIPAGRWPSRWPSTLRALWRPAFPIDDDHLFRSMATGATGLWTGVMNAVG
jgi:hypothetical protein